MSENVLELFLCVGALSSGFYIYVLLLRIIHKVGKQNILEKKNITWDVKIHCKNSNHSLIYPFFLTKEWEATDCYILLYSPRNNNNKQFHWILLIWIYIEFFFRKNQFHNENKPFQVYFRAGECHYHRIKKGFFFGLLIQVLDFYNRGCRDMKLYSVTEVVVWPLSHLGHYSSQ